MDDFYDRLAPFYHLIYADWDDSITRQAAQLDAVIRERLGDGAHTVLDVACGIGTQSLGLAALGHQVTASDLSPGAVARARDEAARRGLRIGFTVGDMRAAHRVHAREFDVVLCADNALPHLLTEDDILAALRQFHACTRPGGLCLVSARDYETMDRGPAGAVQPYAGHESETARHLVLQHRAFDGDEYDLTFYLVEDRGGDTATTHVFRSRYFAIALTRLAGLMGVAGFEPVERLNGAYFQPLLVGRRRGS
jgi:SAM-dependent methyltransferase